MTQVEKTKEEIRKKQINKNLEKVTNEIAEAMEALNKNFSDNICWKFEALIVFEQKRKVYADIVKYVEKLEGKTYKDAIDYQIEKLESYLREDYNVVTRSTNPITSIQQTMEYQAVMRIVKGLKFYQ